MSATTYVPQNMNLKPMGPTPISISGQPYNNIQHTPSYQSTFYRPQEAVRTGQTYNNNISTNHIFPFANLLNNIPQTQTFSYQSIQNPQIQPAQIPHESIFYPLAPTQNSNGYFREI